MNRMGNCRAFFRLSGAMVLLAVLAAPALQASEKSWLWIQDPWTGESVMASVDAPDYSLWDATQIKDYEAALQEDYPPPLAVMTISKIGLQVPVYNGTSEHILDRGAGRIKGMGRTGEDDNLGISAHRDSFFRGLKDLAEGDDILLQTTHGVDRYVVSDIDIVPKEDASVLHVEDGNMLTLVTCYPFYHVGHAPERMIVTAFPKVEPIE